MSTRQFNQKKLVTEYFDCRAATYLDGYCRTNNSGYSFRVRHKRVLELFDRPGGKVLDIGCGPGVTVDALVRKHGCEWWGVDIAEAMIHDGSKRFCNEPRAHFSVGRIEALEFRDDHFDAVVCVGVVEYVDDDEIAIREMLRVLKPGGTLIVSVPNAASPFRIWNRAVWKPLIRPLSWALHRWFPTLSRLTSPVVHREYNESAYVALYERHGALLEDAVYYNFKLFVSPFDVLLRNCNLAVSETLERLCRSKLRWLGTGFVLKVRKVRHSW